MNCPRRSVFPARPSFSALSRLSLLLLHLVLCALVVTPAAAVEQNTAFLPAKINGPGNTGGLTTQADQALAAALAGQGFTMMERGQATQMLNYTGAWPPAVKELQGLSQKTGKDYVAVGSVTAIGFAIFTVTVIVAAIKATSETPHERNRRNLRGSLVNRSCK